MLTQASPFIALAVSLAAAKSPIRACAHATDVKAGSLVSFPLSEAASSAAWVIVLRALARSPRSAWIQAMPGSCG
jgi:hypothetical protein